MQTWDLSFIQSVIKILYIFYCLLFLRYVLYQNIMDETLIRSYITSTHRFYNIHYQFAQYFCANDLAAVNLALVALVLHTGAA